MAAERDGVQDHIDPIPQHPSYEETESKIMILGHPIHAMSVAFPIALSFCTLACDLLYWWTADPFWARAAVWAAGAAFILGMLAAFSGTAELLFVNGIRVRAAPWTHAIVAVTTLALFGANWGHRLYGYEEAVLPYGILLSAASVVATGFTGWFGGKLVFDHRLGTSKGN
jgi:uncharacterized membrane protein